MDGGRFDDLIKEISSKRLTRLSALRGLAVGAAAAVTGAGLLSTTTGATNKGPKSNPTRKKKTICHCTNSSFSTCYTKKMRPKSAKKHLKHGCDYAGPCSAARGSGCPSLSAGGPQPAVGPIAPVCDAATCAAAPTCCSCVNNACVPGRSCGTGTSAVCLTDGQICCNDVPFTGTTCPTDTCNSEPCGIESPCAGDGCECIYADGSEYGTCQTKGYDYK